MQGNLATYSGFMTISDAMAVLSHEDATISRRTVLRFLERNRIPTRKVGNTTIFPTSFLPSLVNEYGKRGRWD